MIADDTADDDDTAGQKKVHLTYKDKVDKNSRVFLLEEQQTGYKGVAFPPAEVSVHPTQVMCLPPTNYLL